MNIGLVNEMKVVADKMGIEIHEVIRAAATKPFGFVAYAPGPGLGGHCILIGKIAQALNERGRAIKGSKILVLGLAYKKNVDDVRESPAAEIMELLGERGALLSYSDPHVPEFPRMREHQFELESVALDADTLKNQDCVVLVTDHDAFDYELIAKHAKLLVDTRGRYAKAVGNIVKA